MDKGTCIYAEGRRLRGYNETNEMTPPERIGEGPFCASESLNWLLIEAIAPRSASPDGTAEGQIGKVVLEQHRVSEEVLNCPSLLT